MLSRTGIPSADDLAGVFPSEERLKAGAVAVIECFERIPCNPCATSCPRGAIRPFEDINDTPALDVEKCNGCALCLAKCPGLAIMIVDESWSEDRALIKIPYEFRPLPEKGDIVLALDRSGTPVATADVISVLLNKATNRVPIISIAIDKSLIKTVRNICPAPPPPTEDASIVCRCSDLDMNDIRELMEQGYTSVDEMKRVARLGMGPCQGRNCVPIVLGELARYLNKPVADLSPGAFRPVVKAIKLGELAKSAKGNE
ncbi:MAG: (2Fe-2S)-binding protein [Defluviitaleaceae bacterium]|nr:(2Fe-2S)-binding protein [Defluviitaleaceae bacterium]